ncbi:MAG: zf-TFIIB domain-containing protein [Pseudomonadota bacterium]|nr:zf-TFIIB domain-containing protein [Pseudomonadota bacterium]
MNQDRDQYSQEEAYFYKLNKDLLERKRIELDAKKIEMTDQSNNPNWMKCPKCGDQMEEIELTRIKVDKCVQCQGIYFDNGELQILLESQEPKGFLGMLRKVF